MVTLFSLPHPLFSAFAGNPREVLHTASVFNPVVNSYADRWGVR
jgi:hypothetical protein